MQIFKPVDLPETVYVQEVVYWLALSRIPECIFCDDPEEGVMDARRSGDAFLDTGICEFDGAGFSASEFRWLGIDVDYTRYEAAMTEACGSSSAHLLKASERYADSKPAEHLTEEEAEEVRLRGKKLREEYIQNANEKLWAEGIDDCFSPIIDKARSSVFQALSSGAIKAIGWQDYPDRPIKDGYKASEVGKFIEIQAEAWTYRYFDWAESELKTAQGIYRAVQVRTNDMFRLFPEPFVQSVTVSCSSYPGAVILHEDAGSGNSQPTARSRGRPPKGVISTKVAIQNYFGDRIRRGDIPDKWEVLIQEVMDFGQRISGDALPRSTAQSYIAGMRPTQSSTMPDISPVNGASK